MPLHVCKFLYFCIEGITFVDGGHLQTMQYAMSNSLML